MGYGTEMNGCGRFMKYSLFFANFVIFVGGCIIAGLAIWALVDRIPYLGEIVGNNLLTGAVYVCLAGGIIVAMIAFFGCVGASREVKCMLLTKGNLKGNIQGGNKKLTKWSKSAPTSISFAKKR